MKLVMKPIGSKMSGQACVAMLMDIDLDTSVATIGHTKSARTREIISAISKSYDTGKRLSTYKGGELPECAVIRMDFATGETNWVVKWGREIYDPSYAKMHIRTYYDASYPARIGAYLRVSRKQLNLFKN